LNSLNLTQRIYLEFIINRRSFDRKSKESWSRCVESKYFYPI